MNLPPELLYMIGEYLDPRDAISCLQVSQAWLLSFAECAFKAVTIVSGPEDPNNELVPPKGWLEKYGGLIENLDLRINMPLQCLIATAEPEDPNQDPDDLEEGNQVSAEPDGDQATAIVLFPRLRTIDFGAHGSLKDLEHWLLNSPRLEALYLRYAKSLPTTDTCPGRVIAAKDRGLHLLQNCQELRRLDIDNRGYDAIELQDLAELLHHWPPSLTEFILADDGFFCPWFEPLSSVLMRMTVLDFCECGEVEDWMFKQIMCSCPNLAEFGWHIFVVEDLFCEGDAGAARTEYSSSSSTTATASTASVSSESRGVRMGPWVCTGLRKLTFSVIIWSNTPLCNRAAMEHLALLKDLRWFAVDQMSCELMSDESQDLFLRDYPWPEEYCGHPEWSLKMGPEVHWIREIWPLLESFEVQEWNWTYTD
ncbi:hypothetical protein EMPS_06521 [Entomortierella parvispora]|uniref:F-box domain-containing protein n=1 Tax=Entomortierella parvispora TaxID=205924 RepID=A0A9P3HD59_9FUNG|nr:hypothetical protein EMPS_06521 [Entomortierella parvispora]